MANRFILLLIMLVGSTGYTFASQDPTAPLGWTEQPKPSLKKKATVKVPQLQSIVCAKDSDCYAILNDKVVTQGQLVSGYKVKIITSEKVVVASGNKQWQLTLFALDIKK